MRHIEHIFGNIVDPVIHADLTARGAKACLAGEGDTMLIYYARSYSISRADATSMGQLPASGRKSIKMPSERPGEDGKIESFFGKRNVNRIGARESDRRF